MFPILFFIEEYNLLYPFPDYIQPTLQEYEFKELNLENVLGTSI